MAQKPAPPETLTAAELSCRDGDLNGLLAWADELDAANDVGAAVVVRAVPEFAEHVLRPLNELRASEPNPGIMLWNLEGSVYWFCEETMMDSTDEGGPNRWTDLITRLLVDWNQFHPAVEWLARRLELPRIVLDPSPGQEDIRLDAEVHLPTLPAGRAMTSVFLYPPTPASVFCPACQGRSVCWGDTRTCPECDNLGFPNRGKARRKRSPKKRRGF